MSDTLIAPPRPFTILDCAQRSVEWSTARLGRLTSSRAADMLAKGKKPSEESASRRNLRMQLALERITGRVQERGFYSDAMRFGENTEDLARFVYQAITGQTLVTTGFLAHTTLMVGTSLDGHIGDFEGLIEIKVPLPATHYEALEEGKVPTAHHKQIVHALFVSGAKWCDWMSFEPSFPEKLRAKVIRVERDEEEIAAYEVEVRKFLAEVDAKVEKLKVLEGVA
jgi:predicted phage-related endonuclease